MTHSHKTQDKSFIKKNEIYMCCCRPISSVNFDEKINTLRLLQKKILQFLCMVQSNILKKEKGENVT